MKIALSLVRCLKEVQSRNFELFRPRTELPLNWRKPENIENIKEIVMKHKRTRMVKDGEGKGGLKTMNLEILG